MFTLNKVKRKELEPLYNIGMLLPLRSFLGKQVFTTNECNRNYLTQDDFWGCLGIRPVAGVYGGRPEMGVGSVKSSQANINADDYEYALAA